uniref:ATP synthase F0 subunit 8 n=1 Tax=Arion ater ater TaxID=2751868 RepID=A0A8F2VWW4_9EUPU|nr:ATP synthase F0 subunit 8 [Arion ater ater]
MPQLSPSPVLLMFSLTVMLLFVSCISFATTYKMAPTPKGTSKTTNSNITFKCLGGSWKCLNFKRLL